MNYQDFLESKMYKCSFGGIKEENLNPKLFDYQKDIVKHSLEVGKMAIFAMTGLGKTPMQLEFASKVHKEEKKPVLILAPLAVSKQTQREGDKFDISLNIAENQADIINGINISNYEKLNKFDINKFCCLVLDESSILKSIDGKLKSKIIEEFKFTPYKLACTATPSPNDLMELGNHAQFLNIMSHSEMLSTFFVNDCNQTQKWRLKKHAQEKFWEWLSSWGIVISKPSDLGYSDEKHILPPLNIEEITIDVKCDDKLFACGSQTLEDRRKYRKGSLQERCEKASELVNNSKDNWLVWCDLNDESKLLSQLINDSVEVKGSDKDAHKATSMLDFSENKIKCLVTKPSIAGFGMNWQNCNNMIFVGLSDSFEKYFQAVRRCYRFGQKKPVNVFIITSSNETAVTSNIKLKEAQFFNMIENTVKHTNKFIRKQTDINTVQKVMNINNVTTKTIETPSVIEEEIKCPF